MLSVAFKAEISKHNAILKYRNLCQDLHAISLLFGFCPHLRIGSHFIIITGFSLNMDYNFGDIESSSEHTTASIARIYV